MVSRSLGSLASAAAMVVVAFASASPLAEAQQIDFRVPTQPLPDALREFSRQSGVQVSASSNLVQGKTSRYLLGTMQPQDALEAMVAGSGLAIRQLPNDSFVVIRSGQARAADDRIELDELVVTAPGGRGLPGASGSGGAFDPLEETRTIETLDEEEIEKSDISDVTDALDSIANVVVTNQTSPVGFNLTVRGLSDVGNVNSTAPTTGVFVDGVLLNQTSVRTGINPNLVDVERVDVFLGPQTTTFSRGTTAGAVNVVTKKPTDAFEARIEGTFADFPDGSGSLVLNAPILGDGLLSARFVAFGSASDGFIEFFDENVTDELGEELIGGRFSLRSQPSDDLTFDFQASYTRSEFDATREVTLEILEEDGDFINFASPLDEDTNDDFLARFEARYDTDRGAFTSNTAFRVQETVFNEDADGTPANLTETRVDLDTLSFSQEFRFDGAPVEIPNVPGTFVFNAGTSINYNEFTTSDTVTFGSNASPLIAGGAGILAITDPEAFAAAAAALGLPADIAVVGPAIAALSPSELGFLDTDDRQDVINVSLYSDVSWRPVSQVEFSAGFRYAFDRVVASDTTITEGPAADLGLLDGAFSVEDSASFHSVTPRAAVSYDWTDEITTFVAFSTGFRPGGIADTPFSTFEFDSETTRTVEVGLRSVLFDERLAVNASAFFTKITDFQTPVTILFEDTLIPPTVILTNAGSATSFGGEVNVAAAPVDGLSLQARAGLNFTEITDFEFPPFGSGGDPVDLSGTDLPNAPKFTLTLTGDYEYPQPLFGDARAFIRADYNLRTDFIGSLSAEPTELDGFDTLDIRIGLRSERFSVELFGENIFDEVYATSGFPSGASSLPLPPTAFGQPEEAALPIGAPGPPRRFGIRARVIF
ncbi:MAG: TonB-dependent receptor [Pseudomonadota bacterium]